MSDDSIKRARAIARRYAGGGRIEQFARRQIDQREGAERFANPQMGNARRKAALDPESDFNMWMRGRGYEDDGGLYAQHMRLHEFADPFVRWNRTREHSFLDYLMGTDQRPDGVGVPEAVPYAVGGPVGGGDPIPADPYQETGIGVPADAPGVGGRSWLDGPAWGTPNKSWRDLLGYAGQELGDNANLPFEMTGIPSMIRGSRTMMDDNPDPWHKATGAAEATIGIMPGSRFVPGLSQGVGWATKTMPRALTTYGALGVPGAVDEARGGLGFTSPANAGEAHAATLPPEPMREGEGLLIEQVSDVTRPELPPIPEMPKMFEGKPRSRTQVQTIQQDLIKRGFLPPKKPDGRPSDDGDDGGGTREAEFNAKMQAYDKALERRTQIIDSMARGSAAEADLKRTNEAEATRKAGEEKSKRFEDAKSVYDKDKSAWHTGTQMVAPVIGPALGMAVGAGWGAYTGYKGKKVAREAMEAANKIIKGGKKYQSDPKNFNERVGNVNRFWSEGTKPPGPGPFEHITNPKPRGPYWKTNKDAATPDNLYLPQSRIPELKINAGMGAGLAGAEIAGGSLGLYMAKEAYERAEAAARENPTAETLHDLEIAKDSLAIAKGVIGMGLTTGPSKIGMGSYGILRRPEYRPNVNRADSERANLAEVIAKKKGAGKPGGPPKAKPPKGPKGGGNPPQEGGQGGGGPGNLTPLLPLAATQLPQGASRSKEQTPDELAALPLPPEEEPTFKDGGAADHHSRNQRRNRVGRFRGGFVKPKGSNGNAAVQAPDYADGGGVFRRIMQGASKLLGKGKGSAPAAEKAPVPQGTRDLYAQPTHAGREGWSAIDRTMKREEMGLSDPVRNQKYWDAQSKFESPEMSTSAGRTLHANGGEVDPPYIPPSYGNEIMEAEPAVPPSREPRSITNMARNSWVNSMRDAAAKPQSQLWADAGNTAMSAILAMRPRDRLMGALGRANAERKYYDSESFWPKDPGIVHHRDVGYGAARLRERYGQSFDQGPKRAPSSWDAVPPRPANDTLPQGWGGVVPKQYGGGVGALTDLSMLRGRSERRPPITRDAHLPHQSYGEEKPLDQEFFKPRPKRAYGGYAGGGEPMMGDMPPMPGEDVQVGPIVGATGGREDAKPISVPSGSFVIPADIVSAMGGGNTLAGMQALEATFGKAVVRSGQPTPIRISDGEYVLTPEQVAQVGRGDVEQGHRILDALIIKLREQHIQKLASLPGPASD